MNGKLTLYIDQYGAPHWARTVVELRQSIGGKVSMMYVDKVRGEHAGQTMHVGYVIGRLWLTAYSPIEIPA